MTEQTREVIRQRRAQVSDALREEGWEYIYWEENNCIYGAYANMNGTIEEIEVLQILER